MGSKVKNVTNGIVMGMINMIISLVLPFVSRTIVIYTLGTEYVGLGGLFTSILSVLSLSELGVGAAITFALYKPIAEGDTDKVNAILKLFRDVYRVIGLVIVVISLCMLPFLDVLVAGDVPDGMSLRVLFMIYVANTAISYFLFAYKKVLLTANQRYDLEVNIASIALVVQYVLQIIVLLLTNNYYLYVIVFPFATIVNNIISDVVIRKKYPQYRCEGKVSKEELIGLTKNVSGAFLSKLGNTVYLSVDNIIVSAFLGLSILGKYGNYYFVISSLISVFAVVHNSLRPTLGNNVATEDVATNWNYFKTIDFIYMMVVAVCCSCCVVLFQDFERIWAGADNLLPFSMVILLTVYFFVGRLYSVLGVYQEAAGIWWHGKFIPLIAAAVNLVLNVVGVQIIGLPAIVLSSIVASLCINLPGTIWIMFKYYFKNKEYLMYYLKSMVIRCLQTLVVILITYFIMRNVVVNSWIGLILKAIGCAILSIAFLLLSNVKNPLLNNVIQMVMKKNKK